MFKIAQSQRHLRSVSKNTSESGDEQWKEARADLDSKGSTPTSDVHLHPNTYDKDGNMTSYGLAEGSATDKLPKNNKGYTEPSVVLGYDEEVQPLPSGQIGGTPEVKYTPTAGFYDTQTNSIITIKFSDLQSAIKKINNEEFYYSNINNVYSCNSYLDRGESLHTNFMDFNYLDNFNEFIYKSKVNASTDHEIHYTTNFSVNLPKKIINWKITNNEFYFELAKKEIIYINSGYKNERKVENWRLQEINNDEIHNKLNSYWENRSYNKDLLNVSNAGRISKVYSDGKTYILLYNIEQKNYDKYLDLIKSFKYLKSYFRKLF